MFVFREIDKIRINTRFTELKKKLANCTQTTTTKFQIFHFYTLSRSPHKYRVDNWDNS